MDFQKYIHVRRSANNFECLEVPLEPDNTLSIHTLRAAFPRAHGLKFQASAFGGWRTLRADEFKLFAPADGGWRNNVPFFVIFDEPNELPKKAALTNNGTAETAFLPKPKEVTFGPVNGTGTSNTIPIPNNIGIANNVIPAAPKVPEKLYNSAPNPTADRRFAPNRNFRGRFKQQARKSCGGFIPQRPLCIQKSEINDEKNEPKIKRAAALIAQKAMKGKK